MCFNAPLPVRVYLSALGPRGIMISTGRSHSKLAREQGAVHAVCLAARLTLW